MNDSEIEASIIRGYNTSDPSTWGLCLTTTLFDSAQKEIYRLMESDTMLRYVRSDIFNAFIRDMEAKIKATDFLRSRNLI